MKSCNHIKSDGRPCNAPALRKHSYCFFHQQQIVRRHREYPDRLPILEDRAAVQVAIMQVLDRLYLKTIDYKAAALMLYGLQLASTNLRQDVFGRLNSEKVDRYYGNANDADLCTAGASPAAVASLPQKRVNSGAPSKPAVGLGGSVASVTDERYEGCPRSRAEGADLGSDAAGLAELIVSRNASVPEARDECSPARSAGFQASSSTEVPEGRPKTPVAFLAGQPYQLDPDRAAELERIFNTTIPEIKACADDAVCTAGAPAAAVAVARNSQPTTHNLLRPATIMDAPPLSRSDRVGNKNTLNCCHSERSEQSLSSPNTLSGAPSKPAFGLGGSVASVPEARRECSPARSAGFQEPGRSPFLAAAGGCSRAHNSRLATHNSPRACDYHLFAAAIPSG